MRKRFMGITMMALVLIGITVTGAAQGAKKSGQASDECVNCHIASGVTKGVVTD